RNCSFPVANFTDPEFRKKCSTWLKEIANEKQSDLPQITPSLFISPAGPKFIHLLYRFARHVMVEDMKKKSVGTDIPFAEAVKLRPEDMYSANARSRVAYNKLLQIFQREDSVTQEYDKKSQLLIKEIKQIKYEYEILQIQFCKMKQNDQNKTDKTERIQKVRSMWALVMEMLTSLKNEKEVVDSVLDACVDQCILDGTNVVFSVPQLLAHRVQRDIHQICTGNIYEAEKLNFLTVIQLLNEALRTLRDECCQPEFKQQIQTVENQIMRCNELLKGLNAKRLKTMQQHCVSMNESVSRTQEDWEVKWKSFLGLCPFNLMLNENPVSSIYLILGKRKGEGGKGYKSQIRGTQYIMALLLRLTCHLFNLSLKHLLLLFFFPFSLSLSHLPRISSVPLELSKVPENRDLLIEKNLHTETFKRQKKPVPQKFLRNGKDESAISEMCENEGDQLIQTVSPVQKEDPLMKARDELAEEVAKTVVSESPQSGEGKAMSLEDLVSSLAFNPFVTRKQIPRTPENLLTEIRSSWRKAIQTEGSSDVELSSAEVMREEASVDSTSKAQEVEDSRIVCSNPASPVPYFDPPLSERNSRLSSTVFGPQEQMTVGHIIESPTLKTSGLQESKRTEEQEFKCIDLNNSCVEDPEEQVFPYIKKSMNTTGICSESNSRTNVLPSDHSRGSLMDEMLHQSVSSFLSSICVEGIHLGILDETLPEEPDNIDPNKSASSESDVIDSAYVTGGLRNNDIQKSNLDLQSQFNTYEVQKTASRSEEELHQTHNGGESLSCSSDLSLAPEREERDELYSPLELFCLDAEFVKTPSPVSLDKRKYSLSSLLISSQHLQEMASMVHEIPAELMHKLKGK
ncbi:HAUS6 protein, partial [Chordeiles acutipennis]|nr:HAUS6 protein [Chordeiles acutipennis]